MFDSGGTPAPAVPASAPATGAGDIVIHTMPREFYGKEAALAESGAAKGEAAMPKPEPKPEPKPVPPPIAPPPVPQKSLPPVVVKGHSWPFILGTTVFFLAVLGVGGYFAYTRIMEEQAMREEAEAALIAEQAAQEAAEAARAAREAEEAAAAALAAAEPTPGTDTDSDGLTDIEERLYGTDERDPDSDEDTFLDGNEVFHGYHPLGNAPSTLLDTGAVKVLDEPTYAYTMYYPSTWSVALARDTSSVTFKSARQAGVSATWKEKEGPNETLAEWFAREESTLSISDMTEMMTKNGYQTLSTSDDRTTYIDLGDAVLVLVYDLGDKTQIEYLQTFQMMVNSVVYVERDETTTTP